MTDTRSAPSSSGSAPRIVVQDLRKTFGDAAKDRRVAALDGIDLSVQPGEFLVLLGPSGCGKTTLLRCVAGLEKPDSGRIEVNGQVVFSGTRRSAVPPEKRDLNMVFQSYALWPHMSLLDNVAFPLRRHKVPKADARRRAAEVLEMVGLGNRIDAHPSQLSGGQQQRVALARAVVADSSVVLFDEPLSNLDAKVRERLRLELVTLQRRIGFAALYVTHDQSEAMAMADRIVVMNSGRIEQIGSPEDVYERPSSHYVANFVGGVNSVEGRVVAVSADGAEVETALGRIVATRGDASTVRPGEGVKVLIRPEHCALSAEDPMNGAMCGVVELATYLGGVREYEVAVGDRRMSIKTMGEEPLVAGQQAWVGWPSERVLVFGESASDEAAV